MKATLFAAARRAPYAGDPAATNGRARRQSGIETRRGVIGTTCDSIDGARESAFVTREPKAGEVEQAREGRASRNAGRR